MLFESVKGYTALVVGDAIHDRYVFVRPLGKAMKDSTISVAYEREETYRGGVWAAAEHLRDLCARVEVMHSPHVVRSTRLVEGPTNRKLLTLHERGTEQALGIAPDIGSFDLVIEI